MKANSLRIAFEKYMLPLAVVVFQAVCFAGDASQAAPAAKAQGGPPVYDVVVYGDSSGAVIAAVAAKREGRSVILVNPTGFPGGMSASGLGATDFLGKRNTFGGIASEFYDGIAVAYGTNYVRSFEPHVGKQVFEKMIADAGVTVVYNEKLDRTSGKGVTMDRKRITPITTRSGKTYRGKMFIDATYVGDLMAAAGVTYTVGREPQSQYGEDLGGRAARRHQATRPLHAGRQGSFHQGGGRLRQTRRHEQRIAAESVQNRKPEERSRRQKDPGLQLSRLSDDRSDAPPSDGEARGLSRD